MTSKKYPILQLDVTRTIVRDYVEHGIPIEGVDLEGSVKWEGSGPKVNLNSLKGEYSISSEFGEAQDLASTKRDLFEAKFSRWLYEKISELDLPVNALADPGFWRYLSLRHFMWYIEWREPAFANKTGYLKYTDCDVPSEAILPRCYIRGRNSAGIPNTEEKFEGTDFWRSHITRVKTRFSPTLINAMLRWHLDKQLKTYPLRQAAKELNKARSNITPDFLTPEQAEFHLSYLVAEYEEDS